MMVELCVMRGRREAPARLPGLRPSLGTTMISMFRCIARGLTSATLLALMIAATSAEAATATNTVVGTSASPAVAGQPITLTAAVAPKVSTLSIPTGSITFTVDGVARPAVALSRGLAKLTIGAPEAGDHNVTAAYSGDANFLSSTSSALVQKSVASWTPPSQPIGLDVTKQGVVGDGRTDNSAALQALIDRSPNGTLFYFPRGSYLVSQTINLARSPDIGLIGDVNAQGRPASVLRTNTSGIRLASADYGSGLGHFLIRNMEFSAPTSGGIGFFSHNSVSSTIENAAFSGHIGLHLQSAFATGLRSIHFKGPGGTAGDHIGLVFDGTTGGLLDGSQFTGWNEGMRVTGTGRSVIRSSFNRNGVGMRLGYTPDGRKWTFTRSSINGSTFADNDIAIDAVSVSGVAFTGLRVRGTNAAPSGQSQYGVLVGDVTGSVFSGLQVDGGYTAVGIRGTEVVRRTHFYGNAVSNSMGPASAISPGYGGVKVSATPLANAIANVDDVTADAIAIGAQASFVDVTTRGLIGNGTTDNTTALRSLISTASPGAVFYFPKGVYRVSATIDFSRLSSFRLLGDMYTFSGNPGGSTIIGEFGAPLIKADYGTGAGTFQINNIALRSANSPGGAALFARNAVLSSLRNVKVTGRTGVHLVNSAYTALRSVTFYGNSAEIGVLVEGGVGNTIENAELMGLKEGVRATGRNLSVYASRLEVNRTGLNLGRDANGNTSALRYASIAGISMEANDVAIDVANCDNCSFAGIMHQGSTGSPSGQSQVGLRVGASRNSVFYASQMTSSYRESPIVVSGLASNWSFVTCFPNSMSIAAGATNIVRDDCFDW